jgi:hypothetical protein
MLPSIESFEELWNLPKNYFIFYEYFCKTVGGEAAWKEACLEEDKKLCTKVAEAYCLAMLHSKYFAWLFEFKADNPNTTLKTAYDNQGHPPQSDAEQEETLATFCGALDFVEVSVPTPPPQQPMQSNDNSSTATNEQENQEGRLVEFKLLLDEGETAVAYAEAKLRDQQTFKTIQERIDANEDPPQQEGASGDTPTLPPSPNQARFSRMNELLAGEAGNVPTDALQRRNRKRKSKAELTEFTSSTKKSKKGSDEIKGWTKEGKKYVSDTLERLKRSETRKRVCARSGRRCTRN